MTDDDTLAAGTWRQRLAREHGVDAGTEPADVQDVDVDAVVDELEDARGFDR